MNQYIGIKVINAKPMNRLEYNQFRGWTLPNDENGADEGFLVEYVDGGKANTDEFAGYVSWSPSEVFHNAYKPSGHMSFGDALVYLKQDFKVARAGWNGKNMHIELNEAEGFDPFITMKTATGSFQPGWLASQADILAEDWEVLK